MNFPAISLFDKENLRIFHCLYAANTLQKLPIKFTKFNENSMEANSQQIFYIKIVVISSKLSLWSIHFKDLVQKSHEMAHNNPLLPVKLCIAFTLSNNYLAHFHH